MGNGYVAMYIGNDGQLGRTILCEDWVQALEECWALAEENNHAMTYDQKDELNYKNNGRYTFEDGASVQIGALESPTTVA
jgi:hypothetical protein